MNDEELKKQFESTRRHFDVVAEGLRDEVRSLGKTVARLDETKEHQAVLTESTDKKIDLLAETVALLDAKLERQNATTCEEVKYGFTETQALIKFSYAELDRRVTSLEARVGKLEAKR